MTTIPNIIKGQIYLCTTGYTFMCGEDGPNGHRMKYSHRITEEGNYSENDTTSNIIKEIANDDRRKWLLQAIEMAKEEGGTRLPWRDINFPWKTFLKNKELLKQTPKLLIFN